jgi:hypothetical protein
MERRALIIGVSSYSDQEEETGYGKQAIVNTRKMK